jgi:cytochrome c-type biogenesis protein CcmH/NrfG
VVALAAVSVALIVFWQRTDPEPPGSAPLAPSAPADPRLTYAGPFRNVHPSVKYVGSETCAECHIEQADTYSRHPMGRSLERVARVAALQRYDEAAHNPFTALGVQFRVVREGDRVWHRESRLDTQGRPVFTHDLEAHYAIGSGTHGRSYLTARDGYVFQTPISWFSQKGIWDLSPGFSPREVPGRVVIPECLFCHANHVEPEPGSVNRYRTPVFQGHAAIGCERCHGPGEEHAAAGGARMDPRTGRDPTIVNPRHLTPALRGAVCEQCHLEGAVRFLRRGRGLNDFRPGLPLQDFWAVLVEQGADGEAPIAVSHVELMYRSACFRGSAGAGQLGCVSCHDPHEKPPPERRAAHFRERCLRCHQSRGCSEPLPRRLARTKDDSCADCHMPRYGAGDVTHAALTDHSIPRRPGKRAAPSGLRNGPPLAHFYRERMDPADREGARDLGVGLAVAVRDGKVTEGQALGRARVLLERAVKDSPDDLAGWRELGGVLAKLGRSGEALAAYEHVLARAPGEEAALGEAALVAESLHQTDKALRYWRRAVAVSPHRAIYRRCLAMLLLQAEDWAALGKECRAWLELDPGNVEARMLRVTYLSHQGRREEARAEFARIEALRPPDLPALRKLYTELQR